MYALTEREGNMERNCSNCERVSHTNSGSRCNLDWSKSAPSRTCDQWTDVCDYCESCQQPLTRKTVRFIDGEPYCQNCFAKMQAGKVPTIRTIFSCCEICGEPIGDIDDGWYSPRHHVKNDGYLCRKCVKTAVEKVYSHGLEQENNSRPE